MYAAAGSDDDCSHLAYADAAPDSTELLPNICALDDAEQTLRLLWHLRMLYESEAVLQAGTVDAAAVHASASAYMLEVVPDALRERALFDLHLLEAASRAFASVSAMVLERKWVALLQKEQQGAGADVGVTPMDGAFLITHTNNPTFTREQLDEAIRDIVTRVWLRADQGTRGSGGQWVGNTAAARAHCQRLPVLSMLGHVNAVLYDELGFRGATTQEYYTPEASYMDTVLSQRQGLPIALSILYIEVCRSAGVGAQLHGFGAPQHFLSGCLLPEGERGALPPAETVVYIDAFAGGRQLSCQAVLGEALGDEAHVRRCLAAPLPLPQLWLRYAANLEALHQSGPIADPLVAPPPHGTHAVLLSHLVALAPPLRRDHHQGIRHYKGGLPRSVGACSALRYCGVVWSAHARDQTPTPRASSLSHGVAVKLDEWRLIEQDAEVLPSPGRYLWARGARARYWEERQKARECPRPVGGHTMSIRGCEAHRFGEPVKGRAPTSAEHFRIGQCVRISGAAGGDTLGVVAWRQRSMLAPGQLRYRTLQHVSGLEGIVGPAHLTPAQLSPCTPAEALTIRNSGLGQLFCRRLSAVQFQPAPMLLQHFEEDMTEELPAAEAAVKNAPWGADLSASRHINARLR
ncbi:Transglutaminase-like superfamily-domain-containing protein [Tribonema minus]|uniref:Transglutaminase-like superfamily-domain-containing protein n=1 Tax=Tribonema minus TaxID=303371 RepID=A0A836CM08_9STRA|nr:Transglutaminase-like superfamily-domain-containing protein [Tribonema minus]